MSSSLDHHDKIILPLFIIAYKLNEVLQYAYFAGAIVPPQMMKQLCAWFAWIFLATGAVAGCSQSIQQASNTPALPPPAVASASPSNLASSKLISGINNVAAGKRVIARNGGITYPGACQC
jgi:hypothetical protein